MGFAVTNVCETSRPEKSTPPRKTASGEFFANPNRTHLANRRQALKTRLENAPTPTKLAPGVEYTGLYYYGYRYYDATVGRWINRDPLEEAGGLNLYGFVENKPIARWDLLGMKGFSSKNEAIVAAGHVIFKLTKDTREKGAAEHATMFTDKADWRIHRDTADRVNGGLGFAKFFNIYYSKVIEEAGFVELIFGYEHSISVFCCPKNEASKRWMYNKANEGRLPTQKEWARGVYGTVQKSTESPCVEGIRVADLHTHNMGIATVRKGGLEDFKLGNVFPSETDIKNKDEGVEHSVVGEIHGLYVLTAY